MKALIDGDLFQHEFGSMTDDEYKPLGWPIIQNKVQNRIDTIMEATGAKSYQIYLTSDDKSNFRYEIASIQPYKGSRSKEKPFWYHHIRNFLVDYRGAQEVSGYEADDAMSMVQWADYKEAYRKSALNNWQPYLPQFLQPRSNTVICTRDKDLDMVPGWHYTWECGKQKEKKLWWQDEIGGLRCFYRQLLIGDATDNILGLYGVGEKSQSVKELQICSDEYALYNRVHEEYGKRFGTYAEQFLIENARLLWMLQYEGQVWEPPKKGPAILAG